MDRGTIAVIVTTIFTSISGLVLVLRCISRFVIVRKAGLDDAFAIVAFASALVYATLVYAEKKHGLGRNIEEVEPIDLLLLMRYTWGCINTYICAITFLKVSALLQYLRFIFEQKPRFLCWTLMAACSSFGTAALVFNVTQCRIINDLGDHSGNCSSALAWWYFSAAWAVLTDIIVYAIPVVAVRKLNIPRAHRRALIVVFALGGLGCLTSIPRIHSVYVTTSSKNVTRDTADSLWWSCIEINIGITCISLPPLKALLVALWPRVFATTSSGSTTAVVSFSADLERLEQSKSVDSSYSKDKNSISLASASST